MALVHVNTKPCQLPMLSLAPCSPELHRVLDTYTVVRVTFHSLLIRPFILFSVFFSSLSFI